MMFMLMEYSSYISQGTLELISDPSCCKMRKMPSLIFVQTSSVTDAVFQEDERQIQHERNGLKEKCKVCSSVESLMEAFPTCGRRRCVMFAYLIWHLFTWGVRLLSCV